MAKKLVFILILSFHSCFSAIQSHEIAKSSIILNNEHRRSSLHDTSCNEPRFVKPPQCHSPPPWSHDDGRHERPPASFPPPSAGPPQSRSPQMTSALPPTPLEADGKTPHPHRPENCSVATVMYDSCNPKHPKANNEKASREEKEFFPENMSSGFMSDAAGCCLAFAVFSNDCRAAIKDLSFAKRKIYNNLRDECNSPY